jgi:hypothetical protein
MASVRYNLTFPKQTASDPVIAALGTTYHLAARVENTSFTDESQWVQVSLTGDGDEIGRAVAYLNTLGVFVAPPHLDFNR